MQSRFKRFCVLSPSSFVCTFRSCSDGPASQVRFRASLLLAGRQQTTSHISRATPTRVTHPLAPCHRVRRPPHRARRQPRQRQRPQPARRLQPLRVSQRCRRQTTRRGRRSTTTQQKNKQRRRRSRSVRRRPISRPTRSHRRVKDQPSVSDELQQPQQQRPSRRRHLSRRILQRSVPTDEEQRLRSLNLHLSRRRSRRSEPVVVRLLPRARQMRWRTSRQVPSRSARRLVMTTKPDRARRKKRLPRRHTG
jgi:hypothetical protein